MDCRSTKKSTDQNPVDSGKWTVDSGQRIGIRIRIQLRIRIHIRIHTHTVYIYLPVASHCLFLPFAASYVFVLIYKKWRSVGLNCMPHRVEPHVSYRHAFHIGIFG